MEPLTHRSAAALARQLAAGEVSALVLTEACLERAAARNGAVQAFLDLHAEDAREQARASDARRAAGQPLGPLDGIPVALKDNMAVAGRPLTCASRMLEHFVSPYDATAIQQLKAAGAVLLGRCNLDEFAMGSSTENSAFQTTRNPHDLERVPGGSSGGCAAAVADFQAPLAVGSDTGGSIRQPAALCGVVGMKPTYGLVSRFGLVAFASSLDQIGPFARSVDDAALLLAALAGHDPKDSTSVSVEGTAALGEVEALEQPLTLGVPKEFFVDGLDAEVRALVEARIEHYRARGHTIVEVSLPHTGLAIPVYYVLATAEASSNLARFDGIRYGHRSAQASDPVEVYFQSRAEGFGAEVKRRIILGSYVLSSGYYDAYYKRAQQVRTLMRGDFEQAFARVDAILTPTTPTPAFRIGERAQDPLEMYLADLFTISANVAGIPAISIPAGKTRAGLPVGLQIMGPPFAERRLLAVAREGELSQDERDALRPDQEVPV